MRRASSESGWASRVVTMLGVRMLLVIATGCGSMSKPSTLAAQVSGEVEIRDRDGRALVRNASSRNVDVEVTLWESDETVRPVRLIRKADGVVWPQTFRLAPGETQTVRLRMHEDAYDPGTLLRLEARLVPVKPAAGEATQGTTAQLVFATRILSKVWIR